MTRALPDEDGALAAGRRARRSRPAARGRARARARARTQRGRRRVRARARRRAPVAAPARRRRPQRARRRARATSPRATAPTVLTPHAGELGRLLGATRARRSRRHRLRSAREAAAARGRDRRAQGRRHDHRRARRDGAVNGLGAPALATAGTGDVLSGVIGAFLAKGLDPFAAACAGVRRHAARRRVAARRSTAPTASSPATSIAALPRALARRERRSSPRERLDGRRPMRLTVRRAWPASTLGARSSATSRACAASSRPAAPRCARSSRPTATATARSPAARAALAGGATLAGRRRRRRGRRAARGGHRGAAPRHGRADAERARRRARGARRRRRLGRALRRAPSRRAAAARVHVKLDTGMGRLGTRDPAEATRVARGRRGREPACALAGAMTHFATADERGDAFFGEQLARFDAWVGAAARRRTRGSSCTPPTAPRTLRDAGGALRPRPHRRRDLRPRPVRRGRRPRATSSPRSSCARYVAAVKPARRARASATAGASSRASRRTSRPCRSATATACAAR